MGGGKRRFTLWCACGVLRCVFRFSAQVVRSALAVVCLWLQGAGEREIVRVLIDCCGQEATYNAFYAEVGTKLCGFHGRFKFTFQLALWDEFKLFKDHTVRAVMRSFACLRYPHCP